MQVAIPHIKVVIMGKLAIKATVKALEVLVQVPTQVKASLCMVQCAGSGTLVLVLMVKTASDGTHVSNAPRQVSWENRTRLLHMRVQVVLGTGRQRVQVVLGTGRQSAD